MANSEHNATRAWVVVRYDEMDAEVLCVMWDEAQAQAHADAMGADVDIEEVPVFSHAPQHQRIYTRYANIDIPDGNYIVQPVYAERTRVVPEYAPEYSSLQPLMRDEYKIVPVGTPLQHGRAHVYIAVEGTDEGQVEAHYAASKTRAAAHIAAIVKGRGV